MSIGLPDPKYKWPSLSEDAMRVRDALMDKISELWKLEKSKSLIDQRPFVNILHQAAQMMGYKSYNNVPEDIRNSIATKNGALRHRKHQEERMRLVRKHQKEFQFEFPFDPLPGRKKRAVPDDPFGNLWEGYVTADDWVFL
jgi:hypothetical protein